MTSIQALSNDEKLVISNFIPSTSINDNLLDISVESVIQEIKNLDPSFDLMSILAREREHKRQIDTLKGSLVYEIYQIVNIPGGFYFEVNPNGKVYFEVKPSVENVLIKYLGDRYEQHDIPAPGRGYIKLSQTKEDGMKFIEDITLLHRKHHIYGQKDMYLTL